MDDFVVKTIVDAIVTEVFRTETKGCTPYLFEQVQKQVLKEVVSLQKDGRSPFDIICVLKQRLQAIFHNEKLIHESINKPIQKVTYLITCLTEWLSICLLGHIYRKEVYGPHYWKLLYQNKHF